ncbi:protein LTV1 homolog isoform X2 [Gigantopelta aegis]|uniref:protein LTV1 homolog isoform X1 n=1 Tax=Gigantopelta aegis TaxID=1735272 RepID=UPI001B88C629|nr:protein LTV1 homolog isoform X1 [Gigantopelta aegis]XP_041356798.1 protein LTV1 homolog isoform X2 [Gigantopelta aegis]
MPSKKKRFIDKKHAVTFQVVHRSQKDPLQASEDAGQRVLLPYKDQYEKRKEEQRKFGVFFEDDYDYLHHLKDVNECHLEVIDSFKITKPVSAPESWSNEKSDASIQLPSSVFASSVETEVGLLNKAAPLRGPQLDWDPDVVAALDEDFDYNDPENILDDDFIVQANSKSERGDDGEEDNEEGDQWEDVSDDGVASDAAAMSDESMDAEDMFDHEETKSRFTNYSMTSSVIRRNEGLTLLDDRFEKLFEQYDDGDIGALDQEDIEGRLNSNSVVLDSMVEEFEKQKKVVKLKDVIDEGVGMCEVDVDSEESDTEDDDDAVKMVVEEPSQKWDCESILSTYSTLYNHPQMISEPTKGRTIKLTSKLGIPTDGISQRGLTKKQIEKEMRESRKADRTSTFRPQDETLEEKRARKLAIKEERKERRVEKKSNKLAFSAEKKRQQKQQLNVQQNLQGMKLL